MRYLLNSTESYGRQKCPNEHVYNVVCCYENCEQFRQREIIKIRAKIGSHFTPKELDLCWINKRGNRISNTGCVSLFCGFEDVFILGAHGEACAWLVKQPKRERGHTEGGNKEYRSLGF